jgi:hypothetical protein
MSGLEQRYFRPPAPKTAPRVTLRHAFEPVALAENMDGGGAEIDMAIILATQTCRPRVCALRRMPHS